jgi:phage shock protein PspC (stress-responsive transcriptional regulator)
VADRLYRSPTDRVIAGVAGGMATWLNLDPSLVRVAWVLLAILSGGIFVLVYFVMMIVVPLPPPGWVPTPRTPGSWTSPGQGWSGASQGWSTGGTGGQAPGSGATGSTPPGPDASGAVPGWDAGQPGSWSPTPASPGQPWTPPRVDSGNAGIVFGAVLVLLGAWFLVDRYVSVDWDLVWPIVVIGLGVALMAGALLRSRAGR